MTTLDLTPSTIARKLTPEDTTDTVRAVAEAMAERALRETVECRSSAGKMILVERLMVDVAVAVLKQNKVRMDRLQKFFDELREMPDDEDAAMEPEEQDPEESKQ